MTIKNLKQASSTVWVAGQPSEDELNALPQDGFSAVINLRPTSEWEFDETAVVKAAGMDYYLLPIAGAADITVDNAQKLQQLLQQVGEARTLLHCASANRIGALIALGEAAFNGKDLASAIAIGKEWGLSALEPVASAQIQAL